MRDANGAGNGDAGSTGAGNAAGAGNSGAAGNACATGATGTPTDLWTSGVLSTIALNPFNESAV